MNKYMTRRSWFGAAAMFAVSGVAAGQEDFTKLPPNLPVPMDDGACDHLLHMQVPAIPLNATVGGIVSVPAVKAERTIVYCYPRTGERSGKMANAAAPLRYTRFVAETHKIPPARQTA